MTFLQPGALLLAIPLGLLWWRFGRVHGPATWVRLGILVAMVVALAQPRLSLRSAGSDVLVVVDRSRSMPARSDETAAELIGYLEKERRAGDRLGVVSFGKEPRIELAPDESAHFGGFTREVDADGSDVAAALEAAGELIPLERSGRVLVLSDGKATGVDAHGAARRLAARGVAVDFRQLAREDGALDLAVTSLDLPSQVSLREPFQLTATVRASQAVKGTVLLTRGGQPLVKGPYDFKAGDNLLTFRDLVESPGLAAYELTVRAEEDRVPENDVGRGVLRVEGAPRVLVVSQKGAPDALSEALGKVGVTVDRRAPFPLTLDALDGEAAVVIENVPAGSLSEPGLKVLAQYVKEAGGGLVMTGGRRSFGEGGYRKSAVEEVLPVSLEMRQEQRRAAIAMSILMDCSCSMGVTVPDGRTKMSLAGEGAVAALELLNENDDASVTVIDTEPHTLFPLSPVKDGLPLSKVASAFSGGGGIYIGVALRDGRDKILRSTKATRHIVLFADAADSEAPDDYRATLADLRAHDVTVSVIGMGTEHDSDAALLREVASLGGGRIYFAEDPTALPRVFSEETIAIARATFVDSPADLKPGPDLPQLGKMGAGGWPSVGGYNLTYLKPLASVGLRSADEQEAPVLAFWPKGFGRAVAFAGEVDGPFTGGLRQWSGYPSLLERMVRWAMAAERTSPTDAVARAVRQGGDLHVTLDLDPSSPPPQKPPSLVVLSGDARSAPVELALRWEDEDRLGAHFALPGNGTYYPVIRLDGRVLRAPPVALPYSPEFEPISSKEGHQLLASLAKTTGGVERLSMAGLYAATPQSPASVALAPWLVAAVLAALLVEVGLRRFYTGRVRAPTPRAQAVSPVVKPVPARAPRPAPAVASEPEQAPPAPPTAPAKSAFEIAQDRARRRFKG